MSHDCSLLDGSADPPVELSPPEDRDSPNRLESSLLPPDPEPPDPALLYYIDCHKENKIDLDNIKKKGYTVLKTHLHSPSPHPMDSGGHLYSGESFRVGGRSRNVSD